MGVFSVVRVLAICGVLLAAGCATRPAGPGIAQRASVESAAQWTAETTVAKLTAGTDAGAVKVRVTHSARVGAFSWPDGSIELTSALVERLDEDELAAAIAHELGHIFSGRPEAATRDGATSAIATSALSGRSGSPDDAETRADRFATRLLARAGYAPSAMARTLTKVMQGPGMTPACRARLANRIALLAPAEP
jgi:predicted Zn-dependent protease